MIILYNFASAILLLNDAYCISLTAARKVLLTATYVFFCAQFKKFIFFHLTLKQKLKKI